MNLGERANSCRHASACGRSCSLRTVICLALEHDQALHSTPLPYDGVRSSQEPAVADATGFSQDPSVANAGTESLGVKLDEDSRIVNNIAARARHPGVANSNLRRRETPRCDTAQEQMR